MKFITEDDLRDLYRKEPFTSYEIAPGTKITPGARQFLADRQIYLPDEDPVRIGPNFGKKESKKTDSPGKPGGGNAGCNLRLGCRIKSAEALFLAIAEELLGRDVILAQKIIGLKKSFSEIRNALESGKEYGLFACESCTGIHEDNFSQDLDDCFEITEFHIQLGKGKEIISLHRLRCALRELQPEIAEAFDGPAENEQCKEASDRVNQIVNTLSQLICYAAGGETCQRKM